ncbi:MAG: L-serine ammonia-lyase [Gammaproteobacteria bacterium]|nr:L-serine ammonia-lyase [Gammaproteobacteria bacterium]MBL6999079.1 L-serine ammonia-lyase [Gammaproteobacteria bacterium]
MAISVFDLFKIGIGPSSSHTVGPMRAARIFAELLKQQGMLQHTARVQINLFGSLGATGKGHGTDRAVILGLQGEQPDQIDPQTIEPTLECIRRDKTLCLFSEQCIPFDESVDLVFLPKKNLPYHTNGLEFIARNAQGELLHSAIYYSVGGGFVVEQAAAKKDLIDDGDKTEQAYPFNSMQQLLQYCQQHQLSISQIMLENEKAWRSEAEIRSGLLKIWQVMLDCIRAGCANEGILPGGLKVRRRAPALYQKLRDQQEAALRDPLTTMDWVNLYAIAVNEENAAGGRVVTAPTNGAAGIIPAVLKYYERFTANASEDGIVRFLLTAGAIGILYKMNASISGAEVGCQGEVGSACSMAAAGLAEVSGGTPEQVENAAEIGMEHNLGLTCDPINGLVQVPCIERNAMGAIKAINAKRLALNGDGQHFVSLDKVIRTMRDTGRDMKSKYKETARGGLAVNVIEC